MFPTCRVWQSSLRGRTHIRYQLTHPWCKVRQVKPVYDSDTSIVWPPTAALCNRSVMVTAPASDKLDLPTFASACAVVFSCAEPLRSSLALCWRLALSASAFDDWRMSLRECCYDSLRSNV